MNFFDYALRDIPSNLYKRNGSNFTDIAIPNGTSTAITTFGQALVAGGSGSISIGLGATRKYSFAEANFIAGKESRAFTLLAVVNPLVVTQELSVWSHSTAAATVDGISVDKDNVIFRVKFVAGDVTVKWEFPDITETYIVHAVYSSDNIKLFINGELQGVSDIPANYLSSGFAGTGTTMYSGYVSATNDKALVDALGSYPFALTSDQMMAHFIAARDTIPMALNVTSLGGIAITGADRRIYDQRVWSSSTSWDGVASTDVSTTSGELIPQVDQTTGASKAGTWTGLYFIEKADNPTLYGIKAEWNGNGSYSVQSSLDDGNTWSTVTNGELIPNSQGFNSTGRALLVRITFTGGLVDDVSEVRDLTLTTYADPYIYTVNNDARKLTITPLGTQTTTLVSNEPIEMNAMPGIHQIGGNSITMGQDSDGTALNIAAMEFIITPKGVTSGAGGYLFDTRSYGGTAYMWLPEASGLWSWAGASAVYLNGQLVTAAVAAPKNEPQHILFVFSAPFNTMVGIAGGYQIAEYNLISAYSTAPTAVQAQQLYSNYTSYPVMSVTEAGVVQFIEPANPYVFTLTDWATVTQQ